RARIALASGAAAQLVVDAPRLVPLGADDVQAAGGDDRFVTLLPFVAQRRDLRGALLGRQAFIAFDRIDLVVDAAAEHDVGTAPRHVGRDGYHAGTTGVGDDLRLAFVLLGVEHLV